jgi:predicted flap endonuclease-1-like 5' DNA nuclease
MEILAALIGAGVVAVSPFVPRLRPVAKTAVKGVLAVSDAVVGTTAYVSHQMQELIAESKAEMAAEADTAVVASSAEAQAENIPVSNEEETDSAKTGVMSSVSAAVRPAVGAAVKGSMGVADKAKGAAVATGQQLSNLTKGKTAVAVEADSEPTAVADDLTQIKGIGPKSDDLLQAAGICTFAHLAATDEAQLRQILSAAGGRFKIIDPSSWPEQAQQLAETA